MDLNKSRILIIGKTGQLARSFADLTLPNTIFVDRSVLNLANPEQIGKQLDQIYARTLFDIVINTAAYTQVDKAETETALAEAVNCESVSQIARWCERRNIILVNYSTDYVFSGEGECEWQETDATRPVNAYGHTKRKGELKVLQAGVKGLIIRTSWVHSPYGSNFLRTMLAISKDPIRVVADQFGAPTNAKDLATATLQLLQIKIGKLVSTEIFHIANAGVTTWCGFANEIFRLSVAKGLSDHSPCIIPITSDQYKTAARRPLNSRLSQKKLHRETNIRMPTWQSGLESSLNHIKGLRP